jgi:hypothetical protein
MMKCGTKHLIMTTILNPEGVIRGLGIGSLISFLSAAAQVNSNDECNNNDPVLKNSTWRRLKFNFWFMQLASFTRGTTAWLAHQWPSLYLLLKNRSLQVTPPSSLVPPAPRQLNPTLCVISVSVSSPTRSNPNHNAGANEQNKAE